MMEMRWMNWNEWSFHFSTKQLKTNDCLHSTQSSLHDDSLSEKQMTPTNACSHCIRNCWDENGFSGWRHYKSAMMEKINNSPNINKNSHKSQFNSETKKKKKKWKVSLFTKNYPSHLLCFILLQTCFIIRLDVQIYYIYKINVNTLVAAFVW